MPEEQMEIDLSLGFSRILEGLEKAAAGAQRLTENTKKAGDAARVASGPYQNLRQAQDAYARAGVMGATPSQWSDLHYNLKRAQDRVSGISTPPAPGYASGPNQRLASLRGQIARAGTDPNASPDVLKDLEYSAAQAQKRVDRMNPAPQGFAQKLGGVISSSRFGFGGLNPLVGQTLKLLGPEGAALATAAVAAQKLATTFVELADTSARVTGAFTQLQQGTGANGAQSGQLRAMGVSAGEVAGFHQRITTDPTAMGFAAQLGANSVGGPYGEVNEARAYLKAIEGLRRLQGEQRIRAARAVGIDPGATSLNVSDAEFQRIKAQGESSARLYNPAQQQAAADYSSAQERLKQSTEDLATTFGGPLMKNITDFNKLLSEGAKRLSKFSEDNKTGIELGTTAGIATALSLIPGFGPTLSALYLTKKGKDYADGGADHPVVAALDAHADELRQNSEALARLTKAYGETERSRRAIPSAMMNGPNLTRAAEMNALHWGNL